MKTTLELFKTYEIKTERTRRTEHGDLLTYFLEMMNPERKKGGYKEWSIKTIGYFLSVFSTGDLYVLKNKCMNSKNYGACFNSFVFNKKK